MLEPKSRFLLVLLAICALASVTLTYWDTIVREDFVIINDIEGDALESGSPEEMGSS